MFGIKTQTPTSTKLQAALWVQVARMDVEPTFSL